MSPVRWYIESPQVVFCVTGARLYTHLVVKSLPRAGNYFERTDGLAAVAHDLNRYGVKEAGEVTELILNGVRMNLSVADLLLMRKLGWPLLDDLLVDGTWEIHHDLVHDMIQAPYTRVALGRHRIR